MVAAKGSYRIGRVSIPQSANSRFLGLSDLVFVVCVELARGATITTSPKCLRWSFCNPAITQTLENRTCVSGGSSPLYLALPSLQVGRRYNPPTAAH